MYIDVRLCRALPSLPGCGRIELAPRKLSLYPSVAIASYDCRYNGCETWPRDAGLSLNLLKIDTAQCTPQEGAGRVVEYLRASGFVPSTSEAELPLEDPP
jgi:hypothetical protein